jgi:hypothetical protein
MNYKTVLTDNLNRHGTIFHSLYKLYTRRCGKDPFLPAIIFFHPQPPQTKSCTCCYADYISLFSYILEATNETGLKLNIGYHQTQVT